MFIREIPLFSRYEVRISIASWDEKWVSWLHNVVCEDTHDRTFWTLVISRTPLCDSAQGQVQKGAVCTRQ